MMGRYYQLSLDFFVTASFFSMLGYGLCYITFAIKKDMTNKE